MVYVWDCVSLGYDCFVQLVLALRWGYCLSKLPRISQFIVLFIRRHSVSVRNPLEIRTVIFVSWEKERKQNHSLCFVIQNLLFIIKERVSIGKFSPPRNTVRITGRRFVAVICWHGFKANTHTHARAHTTVLWNSRSESGNYLLVYLFEIVLLIVHN